MAAASRRNRALRMSAMRAMRDESTEKQRFGALCVYVWTQTGLQLALLQAASLDAVRNERGTHREGTSTVSDAA
jgi:hypothetical protein